MKLLTKVTCMAFFGMLAILPAEAQKRTCPERLLIWQDTLFGLIDGTGKTVLPCIYEDLSTYRNDAFQDSYIVAKHNGLYGVLDWDGHTLVPFQYTVEPEPLPNSKGFFLIPYKGKPGGVINSQGDTVVSFQYMDLNYTYYWYGEKCDNPPRLIYTLSEIRNDSLRYRRGTHLEGCIDEYGKEILPPIYKRIMKNDKFMIVRDSNDREGVVDYSGQWICPLTSQYTYRHYYHNSPCILIHDKESHLSGLMTHDGHMLLPIQYASLSSGSYSTKTIKLQNASGLWALADEKFNLLTPHRYTELLELCEAYPSTWYLGVLPDETAVVLDNLGRELHIDPPIAFSKEDVPFDYPMVMVDGTWQLVNPSGKRLPQRYSSASHYWSSSLMSVATDSLHHGIVDTKGHVVVPLRYTEADAVGDDLIYARKASGEVVVFNGKGRKLVTCWGVEWEWPNLMIANQEGKWAMADKKTGRVLSRYYDYFHSVFPATNSYNYHPIYLAAVDDQGKMGYINEYGKEIYPCNLNLSSISDISENTFHKFIMVECSCGGLGYYPIIKKD